MRSVKSGARRDGGTPGADHNQGRVLVTAPGFDTDGRETGARLRRSGLTVDNAGVRGNRRPGEVADLVRGATAVIASSDPFTKTVFEAAPDLRIIARSGVGTDSIDLEAATRSAVLVTTTPGLNDETCADHTLALLLGVVRRVVEHDSSVRRGEWDRGGSLTAWDLHGKRVGVVGFGRIGRQVVQRLEGFRTQIRIFDPAVAGHQFSCATLAELLSWADIVTLHAPLTPETKGMIGGAELALMKPGAILVNTSRGPLVDENALLEALTSGRLAGAALDVFEQEPPMNSRWSVLSNVVLSPHIGGLSADAIERMARTCVQQVLDVLDGKVPDGVVNPDALDRRRPRAQADASVQAGGSVDVRSARSAIGESGSDRG
jgi:phosphoglycerate dehydrogenase-like enzyme